MIHLTPTANSWFPGERLSKKPSNNSFPIFFGGIVSIIFVLAAILFILCRVRVIQTSRPIRSNLIASIKGRSMFTIDEQKLSHELSRQDATIQRVVIGRKFPQTLVLNIIEDIPVAQINNGNNYIQIDTAGKIIRVVPNSNRNYVTMVYYQHLRSFETKPGTTLTQIEIIKALEILRYRDQLPAQLLRISIPQPQHIVLTFIDIPLTVLFTTKKDIAKNIFILHNIIRGLDRRGIRPSVINLEFDKPVITV